MSGQPKPISRAERKVLNRIAGRMGGDTMTDLLRGEWSALQRLVRLGLLQQATHTFYLMTDAGREAQRTGAQIMTPDPKLRELALAATPGPWHGQWDYKNAGDGTVFGHATGPQHVCKGISIDGADRLQPDKNTCDKMYADAAYLKAANPQTILSLLDRIAALEKKEMEAMNGIESIAQERQRQIDKKGYTKAHDREHPYTEFVDAALAYVVADGTEHASASEDIWPWPDGFKRADRRRELVKAGALLAAAIDRFDAEYPTPSVTTGEN